jgi:prolyl oligopeptidase
MMSAGSRFNGAWAGLAAALVGFAPGWSEVQSASSFGTDKYLWLEEQHAPAAVEWAKTRRDAAMARLTASPEFPAVLGELRARLAESAPFPTIYLLGDHFVRLTRDADHPGGLLQTAPNLDGRAPTTWRTVLDIGALNRKEGGSLSLNGPGMFDFPSRCLPPAFNRCLLAFSPGGSSSLELREFDLEKADFVPNGFHAPANRSETAWLDSDTLLIAHSLYGSPALPSNFPAVVRIWKRGEPLTEAKPIFQAKPTTSLVEVDAMGAGAARRGILKVILDYGTIDYHLVDQVGAISKINLPRKVKYVGRAALTYPYIAVQLAAPATLGVKVYPAEAIVSYDVRPKVAASRRYASVFVPGDGAYVSDSPEGIGNGVAFVEDRGLKKTLVVARPNAKGWAVHPVLSSPTGVSLSILKPDGVGTDLLVKQEGFLSPAAVSLVLSKGAPLRIEAGKPILDASAFRVDVRSARSKDGTLVDYYLVRPRRQKPGPTPTLISGYGSFGVDFDPDYFSSGLGRGLASWLSRGGAYAAAAIRGGGERGEAWHLAGVGLNKQTAFDDFIAVGEDLVRSGFTTSAKLGAFGRSGGGLVTAAMAAERPDLFGALYVGVPVTDVGALSTSGSGIIKGQKSEFGDWDDPTALRKILAYSPYQNLRPGVPYPPILIMTSTEDNQVGPGQARKFAARLEEIGAKPLLIEEPLGGHGVPDQIRQPELVAAETVFFIDALMK